MIAPENREEIEKLLKPIELPALSPNPLVSLLTPNYNYAKYVGEAIESALGQTYTNFEMIVCDDGSTDDSCEVVAYHTQRDPRIKLLRQGENRGVSAALNAAYAESRGEIVCLLDADDRYLPEKLAMVVRAFQAHSDRGFLGHRMFQVDAEGQRLGVTPLLADHPSGWYGPFVVSYGDVPPGLTFGSGLCLRRTIGDLIFPLPEEFRTGSDGLLLALAPLMTPIIGISAPLAEYRHHGKNVTSTAHITPEFLDHQLRIDRMYWELRKEYLAGCHPRLAEVFAGFDHRIGTLVTNYVQARLQRSGTTLHAYKRLVDAERFAALHPVARWFWRCSVLLPRPAFRHSLNGALRPNRLKQVIWTTRDALKLRTKFVSHESPAA